MKLYEFTKKHLGYLFNRIYSIKAEGIENIPEFGGAIIASNHSSYLDSIVLCNFLDRKIHFLVHQNFNKFPVNYLFNQTEQILLDNGSIKPLKKAINLLSKGNLVGIFPEGERSYDGKLQEGKKGVCSLFYLTKKPIIPVYIDGTYDIWPRTSMFPKLKGKINLKIGKPLYLQEYSKSSKEELTEIVMSEIKRLSD